MNQTSNTTTRTTYPSFAGKRDYDQYIELIRMQVFTHEDRALLDRIRTCGRVA